MERSLAEPIRVVYFGTPDYAVPALDALVQDPRVRILLVVTQPDRPAGRGRKLTSPPVKQFADVSGLPTYQPDSLRTAGDRAPIAEMHADLFVVAAYGRVFGPRLLALPSLGAVNLHASILPDYRGASPISAAILEGNFRTGVTLMEMDIGLDTGPILAQRSLDILPDDTTSSLTPRLAELGASLLIESLDELRDGRLAPVRQDESAATITRPMVKADGWIDWTRSAISIQRQIRAMWNWPRAWTTLDGRPLQIHRASVASISDTSEPGSVVADGKRAFVITEDGAIEIELCQPASGRPVPGYFALEHAARERMVLGVDGAPDPPAIPLIRPAADR